MRLTLLSITGVSAAILVLALVFDLPSGLPTDHEGTGTAPGVTIDPGFQAAKHRLVARREIARAVAEDRMTFTTGTAEFLALLQAVPGDAEIARTHYPAATETERAAKQLIAFVRDLNLSPSQRVAVATRLDAEFATQFGRPHMPMA